MSDYFTTSRATSFYYSFLFLPREKRRAIEAVYAFARRGDDLADGDLAPEKARRELLRYREALEQCYARRPANPHGRAELATLAETVERYRIPRQHFEDLILGLEMDLAGSRYETFEDLAQYCYRVASTIGLISIEIFGYRNPRTRDYAVNLGIALQLVNILRDLGSDARRGRTYIPRQDLERFGVQPRELASGPSCESLAALIEFECNRAAVYFNRARQALPPEDRRSMIAAEIMAAIYWRLLRSIERCRGDVLTERLRPSRPRKLWTALAVYLGAEWHK